MRMWRGDVETQTDDLVAYCARYGNQQIDSLMTWTRARAIRLVQALSRIVKEENSGKG